MTVLNDLVSEKMKGSKTKALPVDVKPPLSFAELEASEAEEAKAAAVETLALDFRRLTENVLQSVDPLSQAAELRRLSQELSQRIEQATAAPQAANKSLSDMVVEGMRAAMKTKGEKPQGETRPMVARGKSIEEILFPGPKNKSASPLRRMTFAENLFHGLTNPDQMLMQKKELQRSAALRQAMANDFQRTVDQFSRTVRGMIANGQAFDGTGSLTRTLEGFSREIESLLGMG